MAKIAIKSEKITPFGGIIHVILYNKKFFVLIIIVFKGLKIFLQR